MATKKIHHNSIINQQAMAMIQGIIAEIGFVFYETGGVEAGIDGTIELRDTASGDMTGCIIGLQSKGTSLDFTADTPTSFTYLCDERDLNYWLSGNVPVILVVSRPSTSEAYWVCLKDYFSNPTLRRARKILFNKARDRFDASIKSALIHLAIPKDSGIFFSPSPKVEELYSNLMPVTFFAPSVYSACTPAKTGREAWNTLNKYSTDIGCEWILTEGQIRSFHNLRDHPWNKLCDMGTVEQDCSVEWACTEDENKKRDFVKLLNLSLTQKLKQDCNWYRDKHYHFFRETADLSDRTVSYRGLQHATSRDVFKVYRSKKEPEKIVYCRHLAFRHYFQRFDDQWYLEVNPTYHYTRDGRTLSFYYEEKLQGIKRMERNNAVFGQVHFLAQYLAPAHDLFSEAYPFLELGPLLRFDISVGLDDAAWRPKEDEDEAQALIAEEATEDADAAGSLRFHF